MSSRDAFNKTMIEIKTQFDKQREGEAQLQLHLSQMIEFKEQSELNQPGRTNGITEKDIFTAVYPFIIEILRTRPLNGRFKDTRHDLRQTSLTILHLFYNHIHNTESIERCKELVEICFSVLRSESEDIADIAYKILSQIFTIKPDQRKVQLSEFKKEVIAFCEDYLGFLAQVPTLAKNYTTYELENSTILLPPHLKDQPQPEPSQTQKCFTTYGCRSLKIGAVFVHQLLRLQWSEKSRERVIDSVKEVLFNIFKSPTSLTEDVNNQNFIQKLKAIPFFTKGLENMSYLFHTVQFLLPIKDDQLSPSFLGNIEYVKNNFGNIINFFIILAKSLPGHAVDMRYKALVGFFSVYSRAFSITPDEENKTTIQELQQTVKNILIFFLDQLLDVAVLLGTGQVSFSIVHESANLVYRLFETCKDKMSPYQLAKAMKMLLYCLLNPLTPLILKSTIIFCLYKFNVELRKKNISVIKCPEDVSQGEFSNYDLQVEILGQMTLLCKRLHKQTAQGVSFFSESKQKKDKHKVIDENTNEDNLEDIFTLKEKEIDEACNKSFKLSWQHICSTVDISTPKIHPQQQSIDTPTTLAQKKEHYSRTAKNLFLFVENILIFIKDLQEKPTLSLLVMQHVEKFFVHGCHLIQNLSEILGAQEENKMKEVCKSFQILLHQLRVSQFRDLLHSVGDEVFSLIINCEVKGKEGGMSIVSKFFMTFSNNIQGQHPMGYNLAQGSKNTDDYISVYLDMFFNYIKRKINVYNPINEENKDLRFGLCKQERKLGKNSYIKIQETMQKKLFQIGEQCLHRANDIRVKHTFFGVFIYCIQAIRSGHIVPKYFTIIRNLWKEICNLDEHSVSIKEIMRDFIPMVQGLIATFLQQKDEVMYVKYTKEICCFVPAKLKHLLDYLPAISKPLVETMEINSPEQVESGIHTLQYWLTALATYPELFDPVIYPVLPELNACLKPLLTFMPNISLKLMGKLGAKTRQYDRNNEFKPRNYSEDGLKITLTDKHSKEQIIFGIDAIIDVLLIKILSYGEQFLPEDLHAAVAFIKCAFLTYVDKDLDIEYVIASIIQAKSKDGNASFQAPPLYSSFDARKPQEPISQMTTGSESHVFEKILRCLIIGCSSLPINTPELEAVAEEHTNFMKWVTQYFTLIYICKNKTLTQPTQIDEINPLIFIDYICEFLYYNINQGLTIHKQNKTTRPYYEGSSCAIKTMLRLLTKLYEDQADAFDNLEIVPILIQKICSQVDELTRNFAVNIAIQILIKELPQRTLKKNCQVILKALFSILTKSADSVVISVQQELNPTLNSFFEAIGVYTFKQNDVTTVEDRDIFNSVVDRIMQNLLSSQQAARSCAKHFLETIAARNKVKVQQLLKSVIRSSPIQTDSMPQSISWHDYLYEFQIERKVKDVFEMFCGGYSQIQQLIQFLEVVQFMLQYGESTKVQEKLHVFIGIAELLLIALEDESEKFENVIEQYQDQLFGPNYNIMRLTKRYMKLERVYLQQNKEYDSYAHTMHTHQFLTTNFFEVSSQAKDAKLKKDIENLEKRQSNIEMKIFFQQEKTNNAQQQVINFEKLNENALRHMTSKEEVEQTHAQIKKKIDDFTVKMFGSMQPGQATQAQNQQRLRVQDISYDYMHDLYEVYPNVRLHCNLTCKMLEVLCDIISHERIQSFIKGRQIEYFEHYTAINQSGNLDEEIKQQMPRVYLHSLFDFYVVEIKAKIICMLFKFFQRDERNIQKKAKDCLKLLLRQESTPNEALPNLILKECVRPILNSLSQNKQGGTSQFQHLGKLIKVCNSCFNDALGKHLTRNYESLETQVKENYTLLFPKQDDQILTKTQLQDEVLWQVEQYNIKIQQIETASGIINSLHHLCQQNSKMLQEISEVMHKAFNFETYLVEDFERKFDEQFILIIKDNDPHRLIQFAYDKISPLQMKMGYLRSDLRQGVAKFFNQNYKTVEEIVSKPEQLNTFLQIVNQRDNFSLRERLSRDPFIRQVIHEARTGDIIDSKKHKFEEKYVLSINMVYIFSKYHPQYLLQQRNVQILDGLRDKWINKSYTDSFLLSETKFLYMKIQKALVIYSRNENSEIQILFDLLKDFQLSSVHLDMRPLIKLCTQDIPKKASTQKKIMILEAALNKIQTSNCRFEPKYSMFEFAFMPLALQCANNEQKFREFFSKNLITLFLSTFFSSLVRRPNDGLDQFQQQNYQRDDAMWRLIQFELEQRQKVSYQSFFIEIIKVLMIILKYSSFQTIQDCCPNHDCVLIYRFLDWIVKNVTVLSLKEHAFYTLSCFGVRMLNLRLSGEEVRENDVVMTQDPLPKLSEFISLLANNVLAPFFEIDLTKTTNKALIKHTLANLVTIFQDQRVLSLSPQEIQNKEKKYNIWDYFKKRYSLKPQQQQRLALCNLIAKQSMISDVQDHNIYRRLYKTIDQFVFNYARGVEKDPIDCKQPLNLLDSLLLWMNRRKNNILMQGNEQEMEKIKDEVYIFYTLTTKLFEIYLISYPQESVSLQKAREQFSELANHCLNILQQIGTMFPKPKTLTHSEQLSLNNISDPEKIQLKAIFNLNICGLALSKGFDFPSKHKFLVDFIKGSLQQNNRYTTQNTPLISFSSINFRLILYPIHLLKIIITRRSELLNLEQLTELKQILRSAMQNDVKKSNERDIKFLQGQLVRDFMKQQSNIQNNPQLAANNLNVPLSSQVIYNTRNEELKALQRCLPHLSIRLIRALEQLRDQGVISDADFSSWVDNDLYKEINNAIFRIVSSFRLVVTQEKTLPNGKFDATLRTTYEDFPFENNLTEFCLDDPNFDAWIKESIMISIRSIIVHMKQKMHQDEAFVLFDNLKLVLKVFQSVKTCQYLLEQLYEVTVLLVVDSPQDRTKLITKEKAGWLMRLISAQRLKEQQDTKQNENSIVNKAYALCLDFLEQQGSLLSNETSHKIFDRLFQLKPCCSYKLRQRMFALFEKFQGAALKHKMQYFMFKVASEDYDQFIQFCQINNLLDFTLYNFKQDISLYNIRESSKLIPMHNKAFKFVERKNQNNQQSFRFVDSQLTKIRDSLSFFSTHMHNYRELQLEDLLVPLSEIIRINPEHSHDKNIAEKIFSKIFWQYWQKIFQRQDHHQMAADFNKMTQNMIKYNSVNSVQTKTQFARTMLEQIVTLKMPQVRLEPEVLQYMAKHLNLWHLAIPMLEDHVQLFPLNERYVFALQELYSGLMEEDLSMGLCRLTTKSPEMRSLYTYAQHQMWEQINTQFSAYINFYAEQEGLFSFLEGSQQTPGKYSRQLSKNALQDMINGVDPLIHENRFVQPNQSFVDVFETKEVELKLQTSNFPKAGSNRTISELDLRTWENLYIQSLKTLKKNELFKDIADNMANMEMHELRIDYFWSVKDMQSLKKMLDQIIGPNSNMNKRFQINPGSIQKVRYHLYQNYILGIQGDRESRNFDDNFKETVKLAIKQWSEYLPSYMDRIQNEYLILFQQIMESNEGGRNMISNQENQSRKITEYRCAMNIWRERLPNSCESMQTWQDILESRNFIFTKLRNNIIQQQQLPQEEQQLSIGALEEPVDICWNNLKLASVSRKHGLYGLAQYYLNLVKAPILDVRTRGDKLMLERFRYNYECNKLNMLIVSDSARQQEILRDNLNFIECPDYDLWMHAEILRLQGEYMLSRGDLNQAKNYLIQSINKNKKEAKTWISYAKLNELVSKEKGDERSTMNALKGYFCATGLNQHKARLIIPFILRIARQAKHQSSKILSSFINQNVNQLPTWLWLFWIPQLMQLLKAPKSSLQHEVAYNIYYYKLCRLYPQPAFYPLRAKQFYCKAEFKNNPQFNAILNICKKHMQTKTPKVHQAIETLISEMMRVFKNQDDNFLGIIQNTLNFSLFYFIVDIESKLAGFYKRIQTSFQDKTKQSQVWQEFHKYFINPETFERNLGQQMILLKNMKDYLLIQKNLKAQTQTLEEVFPLLAQLSVKGLELPDQYIISAQEPLPEKVITIERFDSNVDRCGTNDKKLQFKCSNGKQVAYAFSSLISQKPFEDYKQFLSEERVNQLKLIMNLLFMRHKESTRRGVKFHVAPQILLPQCKMTQEDLSFTDFQETHDYLLFEQGIDPDLALLSQLTQIQEIFETYPADKPRVLYSLNAAQVQEINLKTYKQLRSQVEPYLLQSYYNRIFYNHDNLFIFKKQFTKYHAVNSLFAYVFNQADYQKLSKLNFCKATGCLNFTETKLNQALTNSQLFSTKSFEEIEASYYKLKVATDQDTQIGDVQTQCNLPFRLTPNLVHFMGQIGLHGIFAGVMTSASMALTAHEAKMSSVLKLILGEEIESNNDQQATQKVVAQTNVEQQASQFADFFMYKIMSLSTHKRILPQVPKNEDLKAKFPSNLRVQGIQEDIQTGNIILGTEPKIVVPREMFNLEMERPIITEEFNKKVFQLIEMAQEEARLSQRQINWCAWF